MAVKRARLWLAWYLSVGIAVGCHVGAQQLNRMDPGFDPLFATVVATVAWPVVLAFDAWMLVGHLTGALHRP